jgi:hypothetical protein
MTKNYKDVIDKLLSTDDADRYRGGNGKPYESPDVYGGTTIEVLEFLKGMPFNNLIMAYVHGLKPSNVRVSYGEICCDAMNGRVTIFLTEDNKIRRIDQEINTGYGMGFLIDNVKRSIQDGTDPHKHDIISNCYIDVNAIKNCKF